MTRKARPNNEMPAILAKFLCGIPFEPPLAKINAIMHWVAFVDLVVCIEHLFFQKCFLVFNHSLNTVHQYIGVNQASLTDLSTLVPLEMPQLILLIATQIQ